MNFSLCLVILLTFYRVFLENETIHHFKRWFLILSVGLSLTIPLITFKTYVEASSFVVSDSFQSEMLSSNEGVASHTNFNYWKFITWSLYWFGVLVFGMRFIKNLISLLQTIRVNTIEKRYGLSIVLLKSNVVPHTFFRYLFCNQEKYKQGKIPSEVLIHEEAHAKQWHTVDLICLEIIQIMLWFNPLVWIAKSMIRLNHEFLADQAVLSKGVFQENYQKSLLVFSTADSHLSLTHSLNHTFIQKRFKITLPTRL